jgi:hypothetical protein
LLGLMESFGRVAPHPRDAAFALSIELTSCPAKLRDIRDWSTRRYFDDSGPPRISSTKHFKDLSSLLVSSCRLYRLSDSDIIHTILKD